MPSSNRYRTTASAAKYAGEYAGRFASNAAVGLARWATTDHTGTTKFLANLPPFGFIDTLSLSLSLVHLVTSILGAIASAFLFFLMIAYGIPALFPL